MNWFEAQRQQWIGEMLDIYGFINRQHLMRKFLVSQPQASLDLQRFQRAHPERIEYNLSRKRYEATVTTVIVPSEPEWFRSPFSNAFQDLEASRQLSAKELEWANAVVHQGVSLEVIAKTFECMFRYQRPVMDAILVAPVVDFTITED